VWRGGYTTEVIPARSGLLRVLVVDDNRDAADSLAILVKIWGHDARVAYDAAAALAMASAGRPDVLLTGIAMPTMDGCHLARRLRRQTRFTDTLLVAITGYADEAHRQLCDGAFDHYLIKPVEPPALEQLLLERAQLVRSRADVEGTVNHLGGEPVRGPAREKVATGPAGHSPTEPGLF
jgi:CheY-like chemotaxis protein